jgi:hypothetical protein
MHGESHGQSCRLFIMMCSLLNAWHVDRTACDLQAQPHTAWTQQFQKAVPESGCRHGGLLRDAGTAAAAHGPGHCARGLLCYAATAAQPQHCRRQTILKGTHTNNAHPVALHAVTTCGQQTQEWRVLTSGPVWSGWKLLERCRALLSGALRHQVCRGVRAEGGGNDCGTAAGPCCGRRGTQRPQ